MELRSSSAKPSCAVSHSSIFPGRLFIRYVLILDKSCQAIAQMDPVNDCLIGYSESSVALRRRLIPDRGTLLPIAEFFWRLECRQKGRIGRLLGDRLMAPLDDTLMDPPLMA